MVWYSFAHMINRLHALLHRPEEGYDPVPEEHARWYAELQYGSAIDSTIIDMIRQHMGELAGKRVLDLGGGPGHYTVEFAKRGADVTWFDISRNYQKLAQQYAAANGVHLRYAIGYMEGASRILKEQFDLVFSRVAWNYCADDLRFANELYGLVCAGGYGFVETNTLEARPRKRVQSALYRVGLKIGHPFPPHGKVERLFRQLVPAEIYVDYSNPPENPNDRVLFRK